MSHDITHSLQSQITEAINHKSALKIQAGNSKSFYGRNIDAQELDVSQHRGIINYEPTELVITARAGTTINEIQSALDEQNQMLAFEPPKFADSATLGGTLACNFSGPRRAARGAARDYVLGSRVINGKAEFLHFGGEVMKNVAGYDASRLMCGAMGTLGVLLEASLKVVPKAESELTLVQQCTEQQALDQMHRLAQSAVPMSANLYDGEQLFIRLSSNEASVKSACVSIGGEKLDNDAEFWHQLKEHQHNFFNSDKPLWRLSLASNTTPFNLQGETLYEWNGALRWFRSDESVDKIRHLAESVEGHATLFRNNPGQIDPFHEMSSGLLRVHRNLKKAFDPYNILNPGRIYANL